VRLDRSLLPEAICDDAEAIVSVPVRTLATMSVRPWRIAFIAWIMLDGPARDVSTGCVSLPLAMACAASVACEGSPPNWPTRLLTITTPTTVQSTTANTLRPEIQKRAWRASLLGHEAPARIATRSAARRLKNASWWRSATS